jgi:hypothetical protein
MDGAGNKAGKSDLGFSPRSSYASPAIDTMKLIDREGPSQDRGFRWHILSARPASLVAEQTIDQTPFRPLNGHQRLRMCAPAPP